jgi:hypothetical protein
MREKLISRRGINRLVALILALVLVLAVVIAIPVYMRFKKQADVIGCTVALKKAQDMLDVEFLWNYSLSHDEAIAVVERSKWAQDSLCPAGGDYYLVERENSDQIYRVSCGLHEKDTFLRTRLNAYHVYELLEDALLDCRRRGILPPEEGFAFTVNSSSLPVQRLEEPLDLRWGTSASIDYEGIVCCFTLSEEGDITWFVYADDNHAAVYRAGDGWTGDAYSTQ